MVYIYTTECYSAIKNNEIMSFSATYMKLEIILLCEVSQRKTYHLCVLSKNDTNEFIYKTETIPTDFESKLMVTKGESWWGGKD